ncbi:MAG: hypothetical protein ACYSO4_09450 [Planctomycetota bacterium]|jgi:hypothetical protein
MRSFLAICLILMVSGCPLMERPYESAGRISLSPIASYKPIEFSIPFQEDIESVKQITDCVANKYGFMDYTNLYSDTFIKYYSRNRKNGGGIIQVYYYLPEDDNIHISVLFIRNEPNPELYEVASELCKKLQVEFGDDRVKSTPLGNRNDLD